MKKGWDGEMEHTRGGKDVKALQKTLRALRTGVRESEAMVGKARPQLFKGSELREQDEQALVDKLKADFAKEKPRPLLDILSNEDLRNILEEEAKKVDKPVPTAEEVRSLMDDFTNKVIRNYQDAMKADKKMPFDLAFNATKKVLPPFIERAQSIAAVLNAIIPDDADDALLKARAIAASILQQFSRLNEMVEKRPNRTAGASAATIK